jgi:hypothetical protein
VQEAEVKGVDQDEGLSKMLDSASSSEDEDKKKEKNDKADEVGKYHRVKLHICLKKKCAYYAVVYLRRKGTILS